VPHHYTDCEAEEAANRYLGEGERLAKAVEALKSRGELLPGYTTG
jgi:hypothetical protein